jgi:MFS family permease
MQSRRDTSRDTTVIILAGAVVLGLGFGARSIFGIVLDPMSTEYGWPREIFSLSLAVQNLVWGFAQPFFGMVADRVGDRKAMWLGLGFYIAGMLLSAVGYLPWMQHLGAGVLVGLGVSGTGFGLVLSAIGRRTPEASRARVMATTAAIGSLGQMGMPLLAGWLTATYGWQVTLFAVAALLIPIAFCIPMFGRSPMVEEGEPEPAVAMGPLLTHAFGQPSYILLMFGFFVCGFHVGFMTSHLPAYVAEVCGSVTLGAAALSIVGGANIIGTFVCGRLGSRFPKPYVLSTLYAIRALVMLLFLLIPPSPLTVVIFSFAVGLAWLATVPLTSALVASIFGPKYMATLYGFVFMAHQVGAFTGVWMGGKIYDLYGSYDMLWWFAIGLGVFSALVHLPVKEQRVRMQVA